MRRLIITRLAWRNVKRNWRHGLAALAIMGAGFAAVSLFDGFLRGVETELRSGYISRAMLGHVVIYHRGGTEKLSEDPWAYALDAREQAFLEERLARSPEVRSRVRFLEIAGLVSNGKRSAVYMGAGYDVPEGMTVRGERWGWNAHAGLPLHLSRSPASLLIGRGLGRLLGCEEGFTDSPFGAGGSYVPAERPFRCPRSTLQLSAVTERGQVNALDLDISGLLDAGLRSVDERYVSLPLGIAQRLFDTDRVSYYGVLLKDGTDAPRFISSLQREADQAGQKIDVLPWDRDPSAESLKKGVEIVEVFRNLFMTVITVIAVLAVANMMMKSVSERVREMGTLRALGFTEADLTRLFALEGFFLSLLACALGWGVTLGLAAAVNASGFTYRAGMLSTPIPFQILHAPLTWLTSSVVLLGLSSGTAWLAGRRVSRLPPAEALAQPER